MRHHVVLRTLLGLVAALALTFLGPAAPASAHATLLGTDPGEGAILDAAPETIRFTFDGPVETVPDGVLVFDAAGDPIAASASAGDAVLDVTLDEAVEDGTIVVVWRVRSEDGHPINGSLSFSVGAPSSAVAAPPVDTDTATSPPLLLGVLRWAGYLGLFLAAGLAAFAVMFLPSGAAAVTARRRVRAVARVAALAAALAWLAALPVLALFLVGGGVGDLGSGSTWAAPSVLEYVVAGLVALGALTAAWLLPAPAGVASDPDADRAAGPTSSRGRLVLGAAVVATAAPALTGHSRAASPEALAVAADVLHLVTGSVWLGGLVGLALTLPSLAAKGTTAAQVLARFSGVAAGVLALLVVTGTLLTWRIVGSWGALFGTTYGVLLLVKIAIVLVAVGIAAYNRFGLLPQLSRAGRQRDRRSGAGLVARATGAEAAVLVAALLLTGLLVDRSPDVAAAAEAVDPREQRGLMGGVEVVGTLSPGTAGPSTFVIQMRDLTGEPVEGLEAPQARLASPDVDLGTLLLTSIGPGAYRGQIDVPVPGAYELHVSLRTTETETPSTTLTFQVDPVG